MAAARGRIGSFKNRIARLATTEGPIPADRLRAALQAGLEDQVDHLRSNSDSFSLPAWRKWARLMTDERNAKAWPRVFADGHGLFGALLAIVEAVDAGASPWGGHLRDLYATSLDETAVALDRPALADAARAWRAAADAWDELADSAVPSDLDGADDAVEGAEMLRSAVNDGEAGRRAGPGGGRRDVGNPCPLRRVVPVARGEDRRDPAQSRRPAQRDPPAGGGRSRGDRPRDRSLGSIGLGRAPRRGRGGIVERQVGHRVGSAVVLARLVADRPAVEPPQQLVGSDDERLDARVLDLPATGKLLDDELRVEHQIRLARAEVERLLEGQDDARVLGVVVGLDAERAGDDGNRRSVGMAARRNAKRR